jgi:hypothetical protein
MKQKFTTSLVVLIVFCLSVLAADAGSPRFVGGISTSSGSFKAEGDLAGLGNTNPLLVRLDAFATVQFWCVNPGGKIAPGRNPVYIPAPPSSDTFLVDANGKSHVTLHAPDPATVLPAPVSPTPKQAGCPNGNWTVTNPIVGSTIWKSATINVTDTVTSAHVLTVNFACNGAPETCQQLP